MQSLIIRASPNPHLIRAPDNKYRKFVYKIVTNTIFDIFILCAILCNVLTMALLYEQAPIWLINSLEFLNLCFTFLFIFECILRIFAFGWSGYFQSGWNQFDFFVVMMSLIDIAMNFVGAKNFTKMLRTGPQLVRIFRVLRISKIFRMVKVFENIHKLMQTLIYSLPKLVNVLGLIFIVFFIFSTLGVHLFKDVTKG